MIHQNLQIAVILLVLVFTGTNIASVVFSSPYGCELNQPVNESQDPENEVKLFDDQDVMSRSLNRNSLFPDKTEKSGKKNFLRLNHTLEVVSPPPETF
jgi:hypothetical protein